MKKFIQKLPILFLILLFTSPLFQLRTQGANGYKVLKVLDGDTYYIDLNNNNISDKDEKIKLYGINAFKTIEGKSLYGQMNSYHLTKDDVLKLGDLGKKFAEEKLLNKQVTLEFVENNNNFNQKFASVYVDSQDFGELLLKEGLAIVYRNAADNKYLKLENLDKVYSKINKKRKNNILEANCSENSILPLIEPSSLYLKPDNLIYRHKTNESQILKWINNKYIEPDSNIKIYFVDPTISKGASKSLTETGTALLKLINNTKQTLDIALYGLGDQPEIFNAILNAQKRGVKVRIVFDMSYKNQNIYSKTKKLINLLDKGTVRTDYETDYMEYLKSQAIKASGGSPENRIPGAIMHNKYAISDMKTTWTGSTNVSETCTGGYNANISGVINSKIVAWLYTRDFEYMYIDNKFHQNKPETYAKGIVLADGSELQVYFLPGKAANQEGVIPLINSAQEYLYGLTFFFTNEKLLNAMINAKNRGIDSKLIIDAVEANDLHRKKHYRLRQVGVLVKTENFGGKMHCKTFFADNKIFSFGSMNATTTAEYYNDENLIIVKNAALTKQILKYFNKLYAAIPDKWLYQDPLPEGSDSIGSCSDSIDNDHDGLIDGDDPDCQLNMTH